MDRWQNKIVKKQEISPMEVRVKGGTELLTGIGKGVLSTLRGASSVGEKVIKAVLPEKAEKFLGLSPEKTIAEQTITQEMTEPKTELEKIGKTGEQIGEFMIPAGGEQRALNVLISNVPKAGSLLRFGVKSLGSAIEFAGKTALQTGGDVEQMKTSAKLGAISPLATEIVGGVGRFLIESVPKRIMSVIFKTAKDDLAKYYRTVAGGEKLNPTLAEEALNKGLKGSDENIAVYSLQKLDEIEKEVQSFVKDFPKLVPLPNKKSFIGLLDTIKKQFSGGFFESRAKTAQALIDELKATKGGSATLESVLKIRRFIDKMRNTSSFRLDQKLTPRQEEFKMATNYLREKISQSGLGKLMNEERFFIQAFDSIVQNAVKSKNTKLLNLTDIIIGGGGLAGGFPGTGAGAATAIRAFQQSFTLTNMAQALWKLKNVPNITPEIIKAIPAILNQRKQETKQQLKLR
jgi:hypothetical protein